MQYSHDSSERPFIEFSNVCKTFDGRSLVVRDLNLCVGKGEFMSFLGPSGSGKTTSLMMLAGFEAPTDGRILLAGSPIENTPPHKRNIGMVFQNYALFPHMTVAQNIGFPLRVRGLGRAERDAKIRRALDLIKLPHVENRYPRQLSGGQQQRVALARALIFDPLIVLMDEPLGALDRQLREEMQLEIKRLHRELGLTIVYVTHDQLEALTMSDRIAVFNAGAVRQVGTPEAIYNRPDDAFVAAFVGDSNHITGTVNSCDGRYCTVDIGAEAPVAASASSAQPIGAPVIVAVRSERVQVVDNPDGKSIFISGIIKEILFQGDYIKIVAVYNEDKIISTRIPPYKYKGQSIGSKIDLSWNKEDCLVVQN